MNIQFKRNAALGILAAAMIGMCSQGFAGEDAVRGGNDAIWQKYLPNGTRTQAEMTVARIGVGGAEVFRGDECPVGSGSYCSDESPYCFMCKGDYACCWTNEVWRCCD